MWPGGFAHAVDFKYPDVEAEKVLERVKREGRRGHQEQARLVEAQSDLQLLKDDLVGHLVLEGVGLLGAGALQHRLVAVQPRLLGPVPNLPSETFV